MEVAVVGQSLLRETGGKAALAQDEAEWNLEAALRRHGGKVESRETTGLQTIVFKLPCTWERAGAVPLGN